ncbi:MAG: riboflavin synthase [Candidatus Marinimicrobia bacterium]|nr:riboflavin synthase [Candidatus Neomarinimicrobiota bacterium]
MFTGLVEEVGTLQKSISNRDGKELQIAAQKVLADVSLGDSIAIDGVCLSVTNFSRSHFSVQAVHETLRKTTLGHLQTGSRINLERAMQANGRFGGHIVQGHIDGTGTIAAINNFQNSVEIEITLPDHLMKYIVPKGSVAVSGISLTVAEKYPHSILIAVIPITLKDTNLATQKIGNAVNIETDIFAKYIENFLEHKNTPDIVSKMKNWGY